MTILLGGCGSPPPIPTAGSPQAHTRSALRPTSNQSPSPVPTSPGAVGAVPATATFTPAIASLTPSPIATPSSTPTARPSPTATPDPFAPFYIESLAARSYGEGPIKIGAIQDQAPGFTHYAFSYPSDGLRITGYLLLPDGDGPFPVILLNHGYYNPNRYHQGNGTLAAARYLAQRGYLTLASDYRNYAGSDTGPNPFRFGYVIDVMNLLASVDSLPKEWADPSRIGMWGHSMGGGITINAAVLAGDRLQAAVIYGAMSGSIADNSRHVQAMGWKRQEFARPISEWGGPDEQPEAYSRLGAIHYLELAQAALSIHHGTHDEQVPYPWSEKLRDAAISAGLQVEHFSYPHGPHSFRGDTWRRFMERVSRFFDTHLREGLKKAAQQQGE